MTERLDQRDSFAWEFESEIVETQGDRVYLRASAFYPEGGGQMADHGVLIHEGVEYQVIDTQLVGDRVAHTVGTVDDVELPTKGKRVKSGAVLFRVRHGDRDIAFPSPLSGRVSRVNHELTFNLDLFLPTPLPLSFQMLAIGSGSAGNFSNPVNVVIQ